MLVKRSSENTLTYALICFLFFRHDFIQMFSVFFMFLVFVIWLKNIIYYLLNLMPLNFHCQKSSFPNKQTFSYWWKVEYTTPRYLMKVFHVSLYALETAFIKLPQRKISHCVSSLTSFTQRSSQQGLPYKQFSQTLLIYWKAENRWSYW